MREEETRRGDEGKEERGKTIPPNVPLPGPTVPPIVPPPPTPAPTQDED